MFPVTSLEEVLQACDPAEPLQPGDSRYVDFSELRHRVGVSLLKRPLLLPTAPGGFHHRCLCGHRGSGKSTELLSLKQWADSNGFFTVITEVEDRFGPIDLEFSDLFLLAATSVEAAMEQNGTPLPAEVVKNLLQWFSDVTHQDTNTVNSEIAVEAGGQLNGKLPLGLGKLFAKLSAGVKAGASHAVTIRQQIKNYPESLVDKTNHLLDIANQKLAESGKPRGILLLFDNLDRYTPEQVHNVLFRSSDLINRLKCHAIFTIPVALEYEPISGPSQDCFGYHVVLPMLSLRKKTDSWRDTVENTPYKDDAVAMVRQALSRRIDIDSVFEDTEDAFLLIKMSGGCIRDLMHLVTNAFTFTEETDTLLTATAIRRGIKDIRATYIRRLTTEDYERLAEIAHRRAVPRDERTRRLLFHRWALEYINGANDPWIDIHPLVLEIQEFQDAYEKARIIA